MAPPSSDTALHRSLKSALAGLSIAPEQVPGQKTLRKIAGCQLRLFRLLDLQAWTAEREMSA